MKRILTFISILASLLFVSCTDTMEFKQDKKDVLSFVAKSTDLQTKTAGDNAYKENTINSVEWFFFKDAEGKELLHKFHTDGVNLRIETPADGDYADLRYKSYLYAVANITLPAEPEGGWTLEKLLEIPVSTQFTKTEEDDEGDDAEVLDKANLNFIMDTYDETRTDSEYLLPLVPTEIDQEAEIDVYLSRLAVKFTTKIKIQKNVTTTDSFGNTEHWTPILSKKDFDVYMVDALKAGYLSGEPVRRADATDEHITESYFTYGRNLADVEEVTEEEDDTYFVWQNVDPFYTYPQTWNGEDNREPFIKIIFPWMSDVKGSSEFHYKIVLPAPEFIETEEEDGSTTAQIKFTLNRNCWYQVTATIKVLGGTENDYVLVDDVYYSVADWADPSWTSGSGLSSPIYFLVPQTTFHIYSTDQFDIPFYCDNQTDVTAYFTEIVYNDYSGATTAVRRATYTNRPTNVTPSGGSGTSAWQDTHPYSLSVNNTDKYVRFTHSMADVYVLREIHLTVYKNASKTADVIIYQHPAIELKKQGAGDVFVNGHFARLSTNPGFGTTKNIDGVNYYHSRNGWDTNRIGGYNYTSRNTRPSWDDPVVHGLGRYDYGTITDGSNVDTTISRDWYTTDITVTAFSETNNFYTANNTKIYYKIADPRVKASVHYGTGWSLRPYLTGETRYNNTDAYDDVTANWTNPSDILISSQAEVDRPKIAPRFLVSSALNANTGLTWEQVVKRAATYQEAGYPAGRWRLPTEAEMAFIVARQKDGTIPNLYATNTTYWAGSGRILDMVNSTANNLIFSNPAANSTRSVRFVYDLWYWGEEPMSSGQYHANQHIESN